MDRVNYVVVQVRAGRLNDLNVPDDVRGDESWESWYQEQNLEETARDTQESILSPESISRAHALAPAQGHRFSIPKSQPASSTPAAEKEKAAGPHLPKGQQVSSAKSRESLRSVTLILLEDIHTELTPTLHSNTGTTCMSIVCQGEDGHKDSDAEDSNDRKRKVMDRLRRENKEKRLKQKAAKLSKGFNTDNHRPRMSSAPPAHSDTRSDTSDRSYKQQAVKKGLVVMSNVNQIFREGSYVPLPSQEAMARNIGKGGNGVVGFIYHGRREFAVKETHLRQEELETWSSVSHPNVIKICAVIKGDWDTVYPGARICYQMMPRVTGDIKSMLEEKEMPTLCHYFYDFKEDSERAGLVLGNAKYILLSVLNGLKHLHSLGIMHRDIKLQNILVDRYCQCRDIFQCPHYGDTGYGVFISDFDSALRVDRGREKLERSKLHGQPIKYSVHGTPGYRPPETSFPMYCNDVLPEWISLKTDIWSFGTMLVKFFVGSRGPHSQREMATLLLADCLQCPTAANRPRGVGISPFQALAVEPHELKTLQKVALLEKYFPLATELHCLVQACLTVNFEERPSAEQVMEKAFFRSISKVPKSQPASSTPAAEKEKAAGPHFPKGQQVSSAKSRESLRSVNVSHSGSQQ